MKRHAEQVWVVLGAFLFFSIFLPLGHICLGRAFDRQQTTSLSGPLMTEHYLIPQGMAWQAQERDESQKDDVCQACLLAQNLLLYHASPGLMVLPAVSPAPRQLRTTVIAVTDLFQTASKRAPPASL